MKLKDSYILQLIHRSVYFIFTNLTPKDLSLQDGILGQKELYFPKTLYTTNLMVRESDNFYFAPTVLNTVPTGYQAVNADR